MSLIAIIMLAYISLSGFNFKFWEEPIASDKKLLAYEYGSYTSQLSGGTLYSLGNGRVTAQSVSGELLYTLYCRYLNPRLKVNNNYLLMYDKNGKRLSSYKKDALMTELELDEAIVAANINNEGIITVITKKLGYIGKVNVYDTVGEMLFEWYLSEDYVIDCDVSLSAGIMVVSSIANKNDTRVNKLILIDIEKAEQIKEITTASVILKVACINKNVLAIGEASTLYLKNNGDIEWDYDYGGSNIVAYDYDSSFAVLLLEGSRNNSKAVALSYKGDKIGEHESVGTAKTVTINDKLIALTENEMVVVMEKYCNVTDIYEVADTQAAYALKNGIIAVTPNGIYFKTGQSK